jgi:formylmethanofuran dehydrogenase subunit E
LQVVGQRRKNAVMVQEYLNHKLECPFCLTIKLRIPANAQPSDLIRCSDCGELLGTWDDLQSDFENQGGQDGVFRLDKGRIRRID